MDSCSSALILREMGYRPVGVKLILHDNDNERDQDRLKNLRSMGIEILEIDGRSLFRDEVVEPFLEEYGRFVTPNPCVICNERAKLRLLFDVADRMGVDLVATGHYVRSGYFRDKKSLLRGSCPQKDQSYMLYRIPYDWVSRLIFPLGEMNKDDVRRLVSDRMGSQDMGQGDSQDICFIEDNLGAFLSSNLTDVPLPGPMLSMDGMVLGRHRGLCFYTEGQRKGLGLGGGPWFVVSKNREENSLILGRDDDVRIFRIGASHLRWHQAVSEGGHYEIQHRYRSRPQRGKLVSLKEDGMEVILDLPAHGVAIGQSLVLYDGPYLLGGGIIDWTANW